MQPTFIKIKFMPLVRHLENENTKCLLEIVPDVSCIENIDKIDWNNENKLVEYSIPVNYKIIFKKDTEEKEEKVYYSCIDFRHLSAASNLACGDVNKVFSDNIILRSVTTNNTKVVTGPPQRLLYDHESIIGESISRNDTKDICFVRNDTREIPNIPNKQISLASKHTETEKHSLAINCDDKVNRTFGTKSEMSKEKTTDIIKATSNEEKNRKLTVTSICTLNTIDVPVNRKLHKESTINNSSLINVENIKKCKINFNIFNEQQSLSTLYAFNVSPDRNVNTVHFGRILPDTRVAHFMMTVENEILPLRIMLSEIYRKCASLGLFWKSSLLKTSDHQYLNKNNIFTQSKPKCNRVVYSIVFEE